MGRTAYKIKSKIMTFISGVILIIGIFVWYNSGFLASLIVWTLLVLLFYWMHRIERTEQSRQATLSPQQKRIEYIEDLRDEISEWLQKRAKAERENDLSAVAHAEAQVKRIESELRRIRA
ncbi:MAG: hypothetical protein CL535_14250 [Ahrensia sp.]|nr:hypothetical protein [Ahrensia sp.]